VAAGAIWERSARAQARRDYPAPGRLVDIGGGRRIQIDCVGTGAPVVVFESGLDTLGSLAWSAVQDQVGKTTRACAYSRAGVMWSDPDPRPFSAEHVAEDLHAALAAAGEKGPYVMVGHSLGGPYVLTFTGRYPTAVAGVVLVESSHPDQIARLRAAAGKELDTGAGLARAAEMVAWSGIVRLAAPHGAAPPHATAIARDAGGAWLPTSIAAADREQAGLAATLATAGRTRQLGDRPLVVLTRGEKTPAQALKQLRLTPTQAAHLDQAWLEMQNDEATWSRLSRHHVVDGANHYIQFDRPDAVISAVDDVVGEVRAGPRTDKPRPSPD
jgi:pimeloyl-ACP methyl ester carboxylesterase